MPDTTLYIKNMVCDRCKAAVESLLLGMGLRPLSVGLGEVVVAGSLSDGKQAELSSALHRMGFELLRDPRQQAVDRIKTAVIEFVHYRRGIPSVNLSAYLADRIGADYSALSKLFSENTGTTIERYFILQKIERIKELLSYGELTLSEIAAKMNYSSTAYLSSQFKSVTGMTPSQFKANHSKYRKQLDKI